MTESDPVRDLRIRAAVPKDSPRLIPLINSAFSVETFLEGPRTDEQRLGAAMVKGTILVGEDSGGRLLASIYTELRGKHGYAGMLAVDPEHQKSGLGRRMMEAAEDATCSRSPFSACAPSSCPSTAASALLKQAPKNSTIRIPWRPASSVIAS